ncbi:hypothetical protein KUCAC02_009354 [Chaenocephalus aceratus]|uniref:Uncharacterized protein n=1 Tax=Chaenocephalus aceratus TaxID=36190 RepID=A0ACB9WUS7_CHAAC|nr:hypothetical protein KUCAC02_009354 [Chaenocephalus aceratus]
MLSRQYQVASTRLHHSRYSLTDTSEVGPKDEEAYPLPRLSPLQKLTTDLCKDDKTIKDLVVGRRVGFYKVRGEIGSGTFSRVKLAFHALTKDKVALKILDRTRLDSHAQRLLSREISSMECLRHPNVVCLYEVVETPSRLFLVLEYAGGGDLHNRICTETKLSDVTCKITFAQILSAVKYMHKHNIIHRDLKAENVLLTSTGLREVRRPGAVQGGVLPGAPGGRVGHGVVLFFMVTGTMPFRADTIGKLRRCVIECAYTVPPWVPGPCQRLIKGMLKAAPDERYALDQMMGCNWLLPVEFPWATLEELGFSAEHLPDSQTKHSRSPVTGVYRILLHRAQKRRGCDCPPVVRGMVSDPKREGLSACRGIEHTSKLCVLS